MSILAATAWKSNAELLAAVHELGYIDDTDSILDATFGLGVWWKIYRPRGLVTNDLRTDYDTDYHYDFRRFPKQWRDRFDVIAYDPPYVSKGGRATTTMPDFQERYGMTDAPKTPIGLHKKLVAPGLAGCYKATRPGGLILQKTQSYITSGKLQPAAHWAWDSAVKLGLQIVDEFCFITRQRPQPSVNIDGTERRQVHARRNYSTLYIWKKVK